MIEAALTIVVLAAFFLLPGIMWGPLIAPGTPPGLSRIGRAIGCSMVVTTIAMTTLAIAGLLRPIAVIAAVILLTAAPLVARPVRRELARPLRAPRRPIGLAVAIAALGLAATFIVVPSHAKLDEAPLPASTTVWYYANLAQQVASTGTFPEEFHEWGANRPFQADYAPFTAHSAAVFELLRPDIPRSLEAYRLAVLVAVFGLGVLLLRRWFSTWLAVLGTVLLLGTVRLDQRVLVYRPEVFAFALGLFALWLVDRAAIERTPRMIAAAAVTLGLVFASHAEIFLVVLPAAAGIAIVRGPLRLAHVRTGFRLVASRRGLAGPATVALIALLGVLLGSLVNAAVAGEFRLAGYAGRSVTAGDVAPLPPERLPPRWVLSGDPAWDFFVAATGPADRDLPTSFTDPRLLPRSSLHIWPRVDAITVPGRIVLIVLLLIPLVLWRWLDARRRRALVVWLAFGVGLFVGSYLIYALSDWYVPQRVGGRRLVPYELFVPVIAATIALWATGRGWRAIGARLPRRGARLLPTLLGALVVLATISSTAAAGDTEEPGLTRVGYDAYDWMRTNLPPNSRILANAYTDGSLTFLSGGTGILDGRAVYLEDPPFLRETTSLLLGARRFFLAPGDPVGATFLNDEKVNYLLVIGPNGSASDLAGYRPFPTDLDALGKDSRYTLVKEFGEQRLLLYRVEPSSVGSDNDAIQPVPL
jgi:hypothetical protein